MSFQPAILHESPDLLVLDKPAGVSLLADRAGAPCHWDELTAWCAATARPRPLLVHRLDKGTSGVLLVALSARAQRSLTRQFTARTVAKSYAAVTVGIPEPPSAMIDLPLCPGRKSRYRIAAPRDAITLDRSARPPRWILKPGTEDTAAPSFPSQSRLRVLRGAAGRALVLLHPRTGRTHQIRVHLAWLGWPLVGETLYGRPADPAQQAPRLALHCLRLAVTDDWSGSPRRLLFRSPLPGDIETLIPRNSQK